MKKTVTLFLLSLLGLSAFAQDRLFVVTDRDSYISGDAVFCSVFVLDSDGAKAPFSATAYLELISTEGTVAEAKIGLFDGRGCGSFRIPSSAATGNYRLLAYTARSRENDADARILSVYNTTSSARVKDGVRPVKDLSAVEESLPDTGELTLSLDPPAGPRQEGRLVLEGLNQNADLTVSIAHEDGLTRVRNIRLDRFLREAVTPASNGSNGEYEGEIITASVEGFSQAASVGETDVTAYLSTAGEPTQVYIGRASGNSQLQFFTGNIYGDRELVCEVVSLYGQSAHISLKSPFRHPELTEPVPVLEICPTEKDALTSRKEALHTQSALRLDTLVRFLPKRKDLILDGHEHVRYHLEDYTRFPTVQEICTEFISELIFNRQGGKWVLRMNVRDAATGKRYSRENILVMMDGVVLTDLKKLADFDAMLLEDVDIYQGSIVIGEVPFNGLVNFVSKKNYVTAMDFPENTRMFDFKGVSYPVAYTGNVPGGKDLREVLLWLPVQEVKAGETLELPFSAPEYGGNFTVKIQGLLDDGTPVCLERQFSIQ